jgi:glycosyltransferase involved in cell wall biosynthesis
VAGLTNVSTKRPIRILELRSVRGTGGGPEKTIMFGAAKADRARYEVIVCYIRDARDEIYTLDERAARLGISYVEVTERHSFDTSVWRQLRRIVRDRDIDIVHAHEYKTDLLALLLGRSAGVVPLATAHGWTGQSLLERRLYYPLDKKVLARFPRVIAVSSEIRDQLIRHGLPADRVTVMLNSIDVEAFARRPEGRQVSRALLGYQASDVVIGAVGRLERQKRFDLLLDAFAPMVARHPALRLAIVGDGSLKNDLVEQARRLSIADKCAFLGQREDINHLHEAFDLFVQSSEYEGTPNAVLEAMAMETPLVATDVGGTREVAHPGVHGLIVPPHDVAAIQNAIAAILGDPSGAAARVAAARRRVEQELSFEARTRTLERLYAELIDQRAVGQVAQHA